MTSNGNKKRSVIIKNKRTSVCLEDSFWMSLHAIVQMERTTIEAFVEQVRGDHDPRNLSSSLRVAILDYFQRIAARDAQERGRAMELPCFTGNRADASVESPRDLRNKVVAFWSGVRSTEASYAK